MSFSRFFFNQVLNGATTRGAFNLARQAVAFGALGPTPQLDDNGNGIANEFIDGALARRYAIGAGVLLAGDDPLVGSVSVDTNLVSNFETITVNGVTTTGTVAEVVAVVTAPDGRVTTQPLPARGADYADRSYGLCGPPGGYEVAVYALDADGNASVPAIAQADRAAACQDFQFFSGFE